MRLPNIDIGDIFHEKQEIRSIFIFDATKLT